MPLLEGKVAIVTGASRGIGRAIAEAFAYFGAKGVVINSREESRESARDVVAVIESYGAGGLWVPGPIEEQETSRNLIEKTMDAFGGINILVNNAGKTIDKLFIKLKPAELEEVMRVNCFSGFLTTQAALRLMVAEKSGSVIFMSSVAARGNPGQAIYAASKAAVEGLTKTLAVEYGKTGIRFNAIAPALVQTQMADRLSEEQKNMLIRQSPLGRIITASEIADVAVILASNFSRVINGQVIYADGGMVR